MTEGGEKGKSEGGEGENQGGKLPPPVQMLVALICSISTITSPASSLIIISVIFTRTEEPGPSCSGRSEQRIYEEHLSLLLERK